MAIADRKLREKQEREKLILTRSDDLLGLHGYLGFNLDELATLIEYSKATIYNHFQSKEDIVLAVSTMHLVTRTEYFSRALTFDGNSRERMFVLGVADMILARLHPHWFPIMQLVQTQSLWEKAAEPRHQAYHQANGRMMGVVDEILRQARHSGDLPEEAPSDNHIVAGLVGLSKGSHLLAQGPAVFTEDSAIRPLDVLFDNYNIYLDGCGWTPLRTEWDYDASRERIQNEVFPEEISLLTK